MAGRNLHALQPIKKFHSETNKTPGIKTNMQEEIRRKTEMLNREAQKVYCAIERQNFHLVDLEHQTEKVENKSKILTGKLLRTMKEIRKDGRNTIIVALTITLVMLLLYLV